MIPIAYNEVDDWESVEITIKKGGVLKGKFTILRVDRKTLPKGLHAYDIRHGDDGDWTSMITIENHVLVNHCGTFVTDRELKLPQWGLPIDAYMYL